MKQIQRQDPTDEELGVMPDIEFDYYEIDESAHSLHIYFKQGTKHWGFVSQYLDSLPDDIYELIPHSDRVKVCDKCHQLIENYADELISNDKVVCDEHV